MGLIVSEISGGQRSAGSGRNETDCNSLKCVYTVELICISNCLGDEIFVIVRVTDVLISQEASGEGGGGETQ